MLRRGWVGVRGPFDGRPIRCDARRRLFFFLRDRKVEAARWVDRGLDFAETKAIYENLRKRLLPTGASIVNKSYREEAEITADDKALMKKIQTPKVRCGPPTRAG